MSIFQTLKNYVFPIYCLGCNKEGALLCKPCSQNIVLESTLHGKIFPVLSLVPYKEGELLAKLLESLKYYYIEDALRYLAPLFSLGAVAHAQFFSDVDLLCPIPLHKKRFAQRGFNQARLLCDLLSTQVSIDVQDIVTRGRATRQQARLSKKEREENVRDAFVLKKTADVNGKTILLVDDVYTTGSTMHAAALPLQKAGARVKGITLARGL